MNQFESLNHTKWDCKYHVVFIPKYRRRTLYGDLKRHLGPVFRQLAEQRESRVEEGHLMPDHVHMLLSIPPKYAVSQVVGVSWIMRTREMSCVWRWVGSGWPHDLRRVSYRRGSQSADRAGSRRFGRRSRDKARQRAGAVG